MRNTRRLYRRIRQIDVQFVYLGKKQYLCTLFCKGLVRYKSGL